jgi:hypothetical protein
MADHAGTAGAVDHIEGLAEFFLHERRSNARDGIRPAARAPRHDQGHRTRRVGGLGERRPEPERCTGCGGDR